MLEINQFLIKGIFMDGLTNSDSLLICAFVAISTTLLAHKILTIVREVNEGEQKIVITDVCEGDEDLKKWGL
jgi:hypothetical protein